ncbi:MAG: histidine phosphatase family protein [bacterium]
MLVPATLVLIRHAEISDGHGSGLLCGWCDPPLSALGRRQVELLAERLAREPAAVAAYTSPLERAAATAAAAPPPLRPARVDALREIYCGELDGMDLASVEAGYPELWRRNEALNDDDFAWPGGESYRHFRTRVIGAVEALAAAHPGRRVLVFTHSGFINQTIGHIKGARPARWDLYLAGHASITEIQWAGTSGVVLRFDDRSHLAPLARKRAS